MANLSGPFATILIARRLDNKSSGSIVYLTYFIDLIISSGFVPRLVIEERRGFGSRPWVWLDKRFAERAGSVEFGNALRFGRLYVSLNRHNWLRALRRTISKVLYKVKTVPSDLGDELSKPQAVELAKRANKKTSTLVVAEYTSLAPCLRHCDTPNTGVFTHDLFSLRAASFQGHGKVPDHTAITFEQEIQRIEPATVIFHSSAHELQAARDKQEGQDHFWIRPGVNLCAKLLSNGDNPVAVFVGVKHGGNLDALEALLENIWPLVRVEVADAQLWIVGEISTSVPEKYRTGHGIVCKDYIESLDSLSGPSFIGLTPTRISSGISIKVIEYLGLGMPTVVMPEALQGFGDALNGLVVEAKDETTFAKEVIDLFQNQEKRKSLSQNAINGVVERMCNEDVHNYLKQLKNNP